jgi:adenylate cyclase
LRAVRCAQAIKRRLADLNARREQRGEAPLDCGIGLHTGPAVAGLIGSASRANYTVVGDTVNLASRIEGFTTGGEVLVSEAVREAVAGLVSCQFHQEVTIKGQPGTFRLYRVPLAAHAPAAQSGVR